MLTTQEIKDLMANMVLDEKAMEPIDEAVARYWKKEVGKVRITSIEREPFLAGFGFKMEIIVCNHYRGQDIRTAGTDGKVLLVNPVWYKAWTVGKKITVFAHELYHAALGHNLRRGKRDAKLWNKACDHEVNNMLVDSGKYEVDFKEEDWVCDRKYRGIVAERIYDDMLDELEDEAESEKQKVLKLDPDGEEQAGEVGTGQPIKVEGEDDPQDSPGGENSPEAGEDAPDETEDGDGPGTTKYSDTLSLPQDPRCGEVLDALNDDGSEMNETQRKEALAELVESNEISKMAEITAGISTTIGHTVNVRKVAVPNKRWETLLRSFFKKRGTPAGSTWRKLNRRGMARGIFQPSKKKQGIEWMVWAYDLSYSMDRKALDVLNSTMDRIRQECGVQRVTILPFNTEIIHDQIVEVGAHEKLPTNWDVGGGTSFAPIFQWIREQHKRPDGIIVFTDLGSRQYGTEIPGVPTLWASSEPIYRYAGSRGEENSYTNAPPFGETIEVLRAGRNR
jgi:predicted metal-dependent peptidase